MNRGDAGSPPPMMESTGNGPASFGGSAPMEQGFAGRGAYYHGDYVSQPSFAPGQYMSAGPGQSMPTAPPAVANPFVAPFGQVPVGSAGDGSPYDFAYTYGQPVNRQPSNGAAQRLARQPSDGAAQYLSRQPSDVASQYLSRQPPPGSNLSEVAPDAHYVDLNRTSVTPFQAAQYSEISRRLNIEPPAPMPSPAADAVVERVTSQDISVKEVQLSTPLVGGGQKGPPDAPAQEHANTESPFADPPAQDIIINGRDSLALPLPAFSSHSRVPSTPPILPEIQLQQRPFSPVSSEYPVAPSSVKPSPLGSSFTLPSPPPEAHFANNSDAGSAPSVAVVENVLATPGGKEEPVRKRPDTMYTVYDEEDAYGGI